MSTKNVRCDMFDVRCEDGTPRPLLSTIHLLPEVFWSGKIEWFVHPQTNRVTWAANVLLDVGGVQGSKRITAESQDLAEVLSAIAARTLEASRQSEAKNS